MEEIFAVGFAAVYLLIILGMPFVWGFVCRKIVSDKGYPGNMNHGFLWGFFLGLIGVIVCACKQNYVDPMLYMNNMYPRYPQNYPGGTQPVNYGQEYQQPQSYQPVWVCRSCGAHNPADGNFCSHCGAPRE